MKKYFTVENSNELQDREYYAILPAGQEKLPYGEAFVLKTGNKDSQRIIGEIVNTWESHFPIEKGSVFFVTGERKIRTLTEEEVKWVSYMFKERIYITFDIFKEIEEVIDLDLCIKDINNELNN